MIRTGFIVATAIAAALTASAGFAADYTLSVTLDTSPQHVRNVWLKDFAKAIDETSDGRLELEIFEAAAKYKDSEAAAAVAQGAIDIAIPQYQLISRFVPESDFEQLPMFYGLGRDQIYAVVDGPVGDDLHKRIEDKLGVKVLGRPIDLGFGTVFSTEVALKTPGDLAGLKVRVPGGPATVQRYETMGSVPVQISWPDVPQALQTGTISSLWATQESVASAKLWDAGVAYAMEDRQAIVQYVPLINQRSLDALPEDLQALLIDTWDAMVDGQRDFAADRQAKARDVNAEHGIVTSDPSAEDLDAMRQQLLAAQPALIDELGIDGGFIDMLSSAIDG
ncbi:TRAP transporter substrate-binding protein DctP [Puniceibacterium sp. IMCC21224]|uniref:TRAP transporter substrate-binding protein DctP n=1 Tax=Puniceibacterium sp. IMCC21224 TaxID=1618204 RepID=UPI00064D8A42|nr:TRAP transporter substrate-binding protein DctP [Puniceibacterium sp. IMCC21224]KMK68273.1 TRAP-type C4-dicarboxylate transport system, periplasmic component [Puniceibacterium sp. IMCC21224]